MPHRIRPGKKSSNSYFWILSLFLILTGCGLSSIRHPGVVPDTLQAAAKGGDAKAQMQLALQCDRDGDLEEAVYWYRLAAEQGVTEAQNNLGVMYKDGQGVPENEKEAVRWFLQAAHLGNAMAQSNLGWMYQAGKGLRQNNDSACYWYKKAARQGHAAAQNNLGIFYRDGIGIACDTDSARYWFQEAARQGLPQARRNLERLE